MKKILIMAMACLLVITACGDKNTPKSSKRIIRNGVSLNLVAVPGSNTFTDSINRVTFVLYNSTVSYYTDTGVYSDVDPVYTGPTVYSFQFNNSTPYSGTIIVEPEIWPLSIGEPKKDTLVFTEYQF